LCFLKRLKAFELFYWFDNLKLLKWYFRIILTVKEEIDGYDIFGIEKACNGNFY